MIKVSEAMVLVYVVAFCTGLIVWVATACSIQASTVLAEQKKAMLAGVGYWSTTDKFIYGVPPAVRAPVTEKEGR